MMDEKHHLLVDSDRLNWNLLLVLVCSELLLVLLDIVINYAEVIEYRSIQELFNIAREDGLADWFMTSQTLLAALVLWFIYYLSRKTEGVTSFYQRGWLILALFFTYMSADDGAMIHERLGTMFEEMIEQQGTLESAGFLSQWLDIFPSYEWQFLLPFFTAVGLYMLYFLWKVLGFGPSLWMVLAAFSSLSIAVLLDFIEGLPEEHALNIYSWLKDHYLLEPYTVDHFAKSLEEFLEMLGISLFLVVFVTQISRMLPADFTIGFKPSDAVSKD